MVLWGDARAQFECELLWCGAWAQLQRELWCDAWAEFERELLHWFACLRLDAEDFVNFAARFEGAGLAGLVELVVAFEGCFVVHGGCAG